MLVNYGQIPKPKTLLGGWYSIEIKSSWWRGRSLSFNHVFESLQWFSCLDGQGKFFLEICAETWVSCADIRIGWVECHGHSSGMKAHVSIWPHSTRRGPSTEPCGMHRGFDVFCSCCFIKGALVKGQWTLAPNITSRMVVRDWHLNDARPFSRSSAPRILSGSYRIYKLTDRNGGTSKHEQVSQNAIGQLKKLLSFSHVTCSQQQGIYVWIVFWPKVDRIFKKLATFKNRRVTT